MAQTKIGAIERHPRASLCGGGRFADAVRIAEEGLRTATEPGDQPVVDGLRLQLAAYRAGVPWRDQSQSGH